MSDQNRVSSWEVHWGICSSRDKHTHSSSIHQIVRTLPASIERAHVEDINTLHLSKNFETLKTSSLLEIGGHGTRLSTLGEKVGLGSDLCSARKESCQPKKNHITSDPSRRSPSARPISAVAMLHVQWARAERLLPSSGARGGYMCLRSKGLTCLEGSPGLGSPWVPLSTNKSQRIKVSLSCPLSPPVTSPMPLPEPLAASPRPSPAPHLPQWLPIPCAKEAQNSHLLTLLAKLRTGATGRATTARLATVETARRANISAVVLGR